MTRKSQARLQRDKTEKELAKLRTKPELAQVFDDVRGYYNTAIQAILDYSAMGKQLLEHQELVKYLVNPGETRDATITLSNDLKRFKSMFDNLLEQHKDKSGRAKTNEDMVTAIDLTQRYGELMESMNTICGPVAQQLADDFQVAMDRSDIANGKEPRKIARAMATGKDLKVTIEDGAPKVEIVDVAPDAQEVPKVVMVDETSQETVEQTAESK